MKLLVFVFVVRGFVSHSARSAWIETVMDDCKAVLLKSHSARSAWIETVVVSAKRTRDRVALRKECVD